MIVSVRPSKIHGLGVFATKIIKKNDCQIIYGEVVKELTDYCFDENFEPYAPFCFLNHSNSPNCEVTYDEDGIYYITSLRCIKIGEELTIDYGEHP